MTILEAHLGDHPYLVGRAYTIADIATYAYTHVAGDAGYDLSAYPAVSDWLQRVIREPGYINDLVRYPPNALPGHGKSIYDS